MRVKAGSIMMWRSCLLHGVAPNLAPSVRKHLYIAYTPRWVRPTAPDATMLLDPELQFANQSHIWFARHLALGIYLGGGPKAQRASRDSCRLG